MDWLYDIVAWLLDGIAYLVETYFGFLADFITLVWDFVTGLLPAGLLAFLNTRPWEYVTDFIDVVDYFIPFYASLRIYAGAFAIIGGIRLLRWIKSFVPTIAG